MKRVFAIVLLLMLGCAAVFAQKAAWRQATDAELAALLPARAPVEKEHIETEMRTASGIVDRRGHYIAGVVLITAGYVLTNYHVVQGADRLRVTFASGRVVG